MSTENPDTLPTPKAPKRRRRAHYGSYLRSGLYVKRPELPGPDTEVGRVLAERRESLVADLGGDPSTAQLALVDLALRTWVLLDAADAFLLALPSIVDKRHRKVWQVVLDRQRLAASLEATLCRLGLERHAKDVHLDVVSALADAASRRPEGPERQPVSSLTGGSTKTPTTPASTTGPRHPPFSAGNGTLPSDAT